MVAINDLLKLQRLELYRAGPEYAPPCMYWCQKSWCVWNNKDMLTFKIYLRITDVIRLYIRFRS